MCVAQVSTIFPKILMPEGQNEANSILRTHNSRVTCVPVICCLLGACELIHVFACKEKYCINNSERLMCHHSTFTLAGDQMWDLCTPGLVCNSFS